MVVRSALAAVLVLLAFAAPAAAADDERRERFSGVLVVEHTDGDRVPDRLVLRSAHRVLTVRGPRLRRLSGRRVTLDAVRHGDVLRRVRVRGASARAAQEEEDYPAYPGVFGERKVAVVLMSEAEDVADRWDPEVSRQAMFAESGSVDAFFRAGSSGGVQLSGDVHGWYTVELEEECTSYELVRKAIDALHADGVRLRDYHHVMIQFPRRGCPFNGSAWIHDAYSLINGKPADVRLVSHELGHNFGLYHANAKTCTAGGAPVSFSTECTHHEYGDPFSTMGHNHHLFHGVERASLGWLPEGHMVHVQDDGVYTLGGQDGSAAEVISVPRRLDVDWWEEPTNVAVELRRPLGPYDLFAADDPVINGVTIRMVRQLEQRLVAWPMDLLDATPGSPGGHRDAQLRVGEMFVDERSRTAVTLESLSGGVARVRVGWVPDAPPGATAQLDGPAAVVVRWGPSADDRGVTGYEVERDGVVVAATAGLEARDDAPPRGRDVTYRVVALDADGNRRPSTPMTVAVPPEPEPPAPAPLEPPAPPPVATPAPADTTAPRLTLRRSGRRVVLVARDDRPGLRLRAALGGRALATRTAAAATAAALRFRLPRRALRGRHVLVLTARDAAGNRARRRVVVGRRA